MEPEHPSTDTPTVLLFCDAYDVTATEVMQWLERDSVSALRILPDDDVVAFDLTLTTSSTQLMLRLESGIELELDSVNSCWHRGSGLRFRLPEDAPIGLIRLLQAEAEALEDAIYELLSERPALGKPRRYSPIPALTQLIRARARGLEIPATRVTTERASLARFMEQHPNPITKRIEYPARFEWDGETWTAGGTRQLTATDLASLAPSFFPGLFQEYIPKAYELRIFAVADRLFPMAILPTRSQALPVDVRRADPRSGIRFVPYQLPDPLAEKVRHLMDALELNTGALDFIVTPEDRVVFLELNPYGQLDWLSKECHYYVEQYIARFLGAR